MTLPPRWERFAEKWVIDREDLSRVLAEHDAERAAQPEHFVCTGGADTPEWTACGAHVAADEDGCCAQCGGACEIEPCRCDEAERAWPMLPAEQPAPRGCVKCRNGIDRQGRACRYCSWKPAQAAPDGGRRQAPKLSEETRTARAPRPPGELVGALQDRIHPTSGRLLDAKPIVTDGGRLSERMHGFADTLTGDSRAAARVLARDVADLAGKLAAAERDLKQSELECSNEHEGRLEAERKRDAAVAKERARCLSHIISMLPPLNVPVSVAIKSISDGEEAP